MPLIITGHFVWALVVGVIASLCDALDGAVARAGAGPTKAGAFLDSTLDRVSELMVAAALVVYFVLEGPDWGPVAACSSSWAPRRWSRTSAPARRRSAWTARSASCPGRSASSGSASASCSPGGSPVARASSCGGCTSWPSSLSSPSCTAMLHVLRKLRLAEQSPPALEEPPAAPAGDLGDLGDELWPESSGPRSRRY